MQDDVKQSLQATKLIESLTPDVPGFVPLISLVELVWVLSSCFELTRAQLVDALDALLRAKELVVERAEVVYRAVDRYRGNSVDFADCLIERSSFSAGCERTMTFDRVAAKHCGMILIR
jgi:predicted nucleic-acid-binding protein